MATKIISTVVKRALANYKERCKVTYVISPNGVHYLHKDTVIKPEHFKMMFKS